MILTFATPTELIYAGLPLRFELVRSPHRRTVGIEIALGPRVIVRAPLRLSQHRVEHMVLARARWILKHLEKPRHELQPLRQFATGETLPYLGKDYLLRVSLAAFSARARVTLRGPALELALSADSADLSVAARTALLAWYRAEAQRLLPERVQEHASRARLHPQKVGIRDQQHRWGSCSARGAISLNWRLILMPPAVADYIILHELCHLRHANHGPRFWAALAKLDPAYGTSRAWLNRHGHALHF